MKTGEKIDFEYKGDSYSGIFIKNDGKITTIKLSNGYNISALNENIKILREYENNYVAQDNIREIKINGKNEVYILTTGGTIGSSVDYRTGAVKPVRDISYIYNFVNNISEFNVKQINVANILSENVNSKYWIEYARRARDVLNKNAGVVIFHGTDTMQHTASALSFMFEKLTGPIILTGSQRSSDRPSSDAFINIEASINFTKSDIGEVGIVMHSDTSDGTVSFHRGVRARKMHTSRRDAFQSIGIRPLATYTDGRVSVNNNAMKRQDENILNDKMDDSVSIIYFYPGMPEEDFINIAGNKKAVIIMGTGLGHVSDNIINAVKRLSKDTYFFMTSQCLYGSVNLNVYSTGRYLLDAGVIPLGDMLPETAMVKAMFLLANYPDNLVKLMKSNLRGELNSRRILEW